MFNNDTDLANQIARALHGQSDTVVTYKGEEVAIKDLSYKVASELAEKIDDIPGSAAALVLGALVGATSIRLAENSAKALEENQDDLRARGIDFGSLEIPHPDTNALAIFLLGRRYIATVERVSKATEEAQEHVENGGKLS